MLELKTTCRTISYRARTVSGGESGRRDVHEDAGRDGQLRAALVRGSEDADGQADRQSEARQGGEKDVGRRLGQASPRGEAGHGRLEETQRLDPLELAQGKRQEPGAGEEDRSGRRRDGVPASQEPGGGPGEGDGRAGGGDEGEEEDEVQVFPGRREPRRQGRRGQGDGGHDPSLFVPEGEEEGLDLVLLPGLSGELVLVPGEELLEARDVLPEVPIIDGEILPEGRPQGVELPDVGRPDLGDEGQPVEMDEHAAAVAERLERDEVDGRLAPDQERPPVPLPVLQVLPVDLVCGAQDVAVPGFDKAVPVAERDPLVLGVETGLPEEREKVRGLGREVRDVEPGLARLQRRKQGGERLAGLDGLPAQRRQAFRVVVP